MPLTLPRLLTAWAAFVFLLTAASALAQAGPVAESRQVVLVLADSWDSRQGQMRLFEKGRGGVWKERGTPIAVMLGKNGLGWGIGLNTGSGGRSSDGPVKKEGDGKAPAGIFRLAGAFGYDPPGKRTFKLPYTRMTETFECVDDASSPRYNQVLDASTLPSKDWNSSEQMRRLDSQYSLGVIVEHNFYPVTPGAGSCIFMHVWSSPGAYTSGCTAMAKKDLERVVAWLDQDKKPILVQLPKSEHDRFKALYDLP